MTEITIYTKEKQYTVSFPNPVTLSRALEEAGFLQDKPCGGNGTCGKCRVLAKGDLFPPGETEKKVLDEKALKAGWRLACKAVAYGAVQVHFSIQDTRIQGLTEGEAAFFEKDPLTGQTSCDGVAIDVGTTTIAAYLYALPEGRLKKSLCVKNRQTAYGADVISRIDAAGQGRLTEMRDVIQNQLRELVEEELQTKPAACVITGNTTMLHLLTGLDPTGIAASPFLPKSLFGEWYGAAYLPRCMSAYVGADITTAVIACGLTSYETALLVDVGTNGEMALWHKGVLRGCSTAAGPAFEGAGISMGMAAKEGAVSGVWLEDGEDCRDGDAGDAGKKLRFSVIGDAPACGICGTGLIDLIACLLELGVIDETGYMEEDYVLEGTGVSLSVQDVRQVQLAKSAICSGIRTLLAEAEVSGEELDVFCIAGGFGSKINVSSAARIGLIPHEVCPVAKAVGNAAGMGAGMLLLSRKLLEVSGEIAESAQILELSAHPVFTEQYIENMMFEIHNRKG